MSKRTFYEGHATQVLGRLAPARSSCSRADDHTTSGPPDPDTSTGVPDPDTTGTTADSTT